MVKKEDFAIRTQGAREEVNSDDHELACCLSLVQKGRAESEIKLPTVCSRHIATWPSTTLKLQAGSNCRHFLTT